MGDDDSKLRVFTGGWKGGTVVKTCFWCRRDYDAQRGHTAEECRELLRRDEGALYDKRRRLWRDLSDLSNDVRAYLNRWGEPHRRADPRGIAAQHRSRLERFGGDLERLVARADPRTPEEIAAHEAEMARWRAEREAHRRLTTLWWVKAKTNQGRHLVDGDADGPRWRSGLCGRLANRGAPVGEGGFYRDWSAYETSLRVDRRQKPEGFCAECKRRDYPKRTPLGMRRDVIGTGGPATN